MAVSARLAIAGAMLLVAGCQASATPGANCVRASDCTSPLVCAIGRCRAGCATSRDCPTRARCLVDPSSSVLVCSLTQVDDCTTHDCPLHFTCQNGACVNVCGEVSSCPDGRCDANGCTPAIGDAGALADAGVDVDALRTTTWTLTIASDQDDGEILGASDPLYPDGESADDRDYMGYWGGAPTWAFVRYALPASLPSGAHVLDARLHLTGTGVAGLVPVEDALALVGEDSPDAPMLVSSTAVPGRGLPGTMAVVRWAAIGNWAIGENVSPDLSPILQELVDRHGGLASGAHVVLWLDGAGYTLDGEVAFQDSAPGISGPTLVVTWTR